MKNLFHKSLLLFFLNFVGGICHAKVEEDQQKTVKNLVENAWTSALDGSHSRTWKIWLIYNSLKSEYKTADWDRQFESLLWFTIDRTGQCPLDLVKDSSGIWQIASFNKLFSNSKRREKSFPPDKLKSFQREKQRRFINAYQDIDLNEVDRFKIVRSNCAVQDTIMRNLGLPSLESVSKTKKPIYRALGQYFLLDSAIKNLEGADGIEKLNHKRLQIRSYLFLNQDSFDVRIKKSFPHLFSGLGQDKTYWQEADPSIWTKLTDKQVAQTRKLVLKETLDFTIVEPFMVASIASGRGGLLTFWLSQIKNWQERSKALGFLKENWQKVKLINDKEGFKERSWLALELAIDAIEASKPSDMVLSYMGDSYQFISESSFPEARDTQFWRWMKYYFSKYKLDKNSVTLIRSFLNKADFNRLLQSLVYRSYLLRDESSIRYIKRIKGQKTSMRLKDEIKLLDKLLQFPDGKWVQHLNRRQVSALKRILKAMLPEIAALGLNREYAGFLYYSSVLLNKGGRLSNTELVQKIEERLYQVIPKEKLSPKYFSDNPRVFLGVVILPPRRVEYWLFEKQKVPNFSPTGRITMVPSSQFGKWKVL